MTSNGVRRTFLDSLPSGTEVTGGGSGPTGMAVQARTLYIALGGGDAERRGERPGTSVHNPQGASSALFASILRVRVNQDLETVTGPFRLTPAHQQALNEGGEVQIEDGSGGTIALDVLARFPISEPDPNAIYRFANLWGLALSPDGAALFAVDASMNALLRIDTATGRWQRVMRFPPTPNPGTLGPPMIESVPTSVRLYGEQVLVSFLTGAPFVPYTARVLAVNPTSRTSEPFIFSLSSAVDVLWLPLDGTSSQFFVLEFSQNQSTQPPAPGRLLRYDTPEAQVVSDDLRAPVSLAYDPQSTTLYVVELTGRLLRLRLN